MDEGLVKRLTGRDPVKARRMREDFWEFDPTHKLFLSTNHKPEIRGSDGAIWRRVKLVPFTFTVAPEDMDKDLDRKLEKEAEGILRWIVEGALKWQQLGLDDPIEVREATQDYRQESDPVDEFLEDCCVKVTGARTSAGDLYQLFREWFETNHGTRPMSGNMFGRRITQKGFDRYRTNKGNTYIDLGIKSEYANNPDPW
jgi:putative DNA primase/helicase